MINKAYKEVGDIYRQHDFLGVFMDVCGLLKIVFLLIRLSFSFLDKVSYSTGKLHSVYRTVLDSHKPFVFTKLWVKF